MNETTARDMFYPEDDVRCRILYQEIQAEYEYYDEELQPSYITPDHVDGPPSPPTPVSPGPLSPP